jgi:hypothetical protein
MPNRTSCILLVSVMNAPCSSCTSCGRRRASSARPATRSTYQGLVVSLVRQDAGWHGLLGHAIACMPSEVQCPNHGVKTAVCPDCGVYPTLGPVGPQQSQQQDSSSWLHLALPHHPPPAGAGQGELPFWKPGHPLTGLRTMPLCPQVLATGGLAFPKP